MKFSIINKIKQTPRKVTALIVTLLVLALPAVVIAGFGPDRPVYDWNNPDDRKGSLNGPVFNSFINTPTYGDERNFTRIAEVVDGQSPVDANFSETTTAEAGEEYWVRTFVHNNANQSTNDTNGVAENTRVSVQIAEGTANGVDIMSNITADNATPQKVWDTATLVNDDQPFSVSYVPGSASIYNRYDESGRPLPDTIVSSNGTQVGYEEMNGQLPGCFEFSAYVYIKVKVNTADLDISKVVRKAGDSEWKESVTVNPGDRVEWAILVQNKGTEVQNNVVANDALPPHLDYVEDSARWYTDDPAGNDLDFDQFELSDGDGANINFGNYGANGGFTIAFATIADDNFEGCEVNLRNIASTHSDQLPKNREDNADVRIVKEPCEEEKEPIYRCEALKATKIADRKYQFTVNETAENGATVKQYRFDFGDDSDELVTDVRTVEHTFPEDGTFNVVSTVDFTVDGETVSDTRETCEAVIDTDKEQPTPTTPTTLPVTGPGDMIGMFAAVTVAAGMAHKIVVARRY